MKLVLVRLFSRKFSSKDSSRVTQFLTSGRSTVIRHLISKYGDSCVAYFYFDFKDILKQDVTGLLCSLIAQRARTLEIIPQSLLELFRRHSARDPDHPSMPTSSELVEVLIDLLDLHSSCIVLDALDECRERSLLLATLSTIMSRAGRCKVCYSSRWDQEFQVLMSKFNVVALGIKIHQVDNDVSLYVQSMLDSDRRLSCHRLDVKAMILEKLSEGAQGM